jgi:para-nitrobenzyl esterase
MPTAARSTPARRVVEVTDRLSTTLAGRRAERVGDVVVARAIPYATAERFTAPRPVHGGAPGEGPTDAARRGPACPQLPSRLDRVTGPVVAGLAQSEDCQVLSVAAPADARPGELPVLAWLHGGAYLTGGGEAPKYDPARLAGETRTVVVTVTYRLGVFGYLPPSGATPNLGLLDQLEAMRWIRREVAAFGGDPDRVTLAGQSAGADSAYCLLASGEAEGLAHGAILTSAPLGLRQGREAMTAALQAVVDERLGERERLTTDDVLRVQAEVVDAARGFGLPGALPFAPSTGQGPLPDPSALDDALAGVARRVDLLVGWARDDAAAFVVDPPATTLADPAVAELVAGVTEGVFAAPARSLAQRWRSAGGRAVTFQVDAAPAGAPFGACHCIDLPHLFGTDWSDAPMLAGAEPDAAAGAAIRAAWATFARVGAAGLATDHLTFG